MAVALASALTALAPLACVAQESDSALGPGEVLLVEPADEGRYWGVESRTAPHYPRELMRAGASGCVSITFLISPDGSTSSFHLLEGHSSLPATRAGRTAVNAFAKALVHQVKDWRHVPGPDNPDRLPGLASAYATFSLDHYDAWKNRCKVSNLREALQAR